MSAEKKEFAPQGDALGLENPKVSKNNNPELPSIKTRYFSMLIDMLMIVLLALGFSSLFEMMGQVPDYLRGLIFFIVVILYEPILISFGCTIGQLLMSIRVRNHRKPSRKIWIGNAIIRLFAKVFLGWLSFITISFNAQRRAIHDMVSGSVVIVFIGKKSEDTASA
ncbi:MAG: RDD family protein [Marinilabiliaceae bacterium]|nr:RDD family protein [Marinilabiliaceae bacterium]